MNVTILEIISRWISCILVGFISLFSGSIIKQEELQTFNVNENKSYLSINEVFLMTRRLCIMIRHHQRLQKY